MWRKELTYPQISHTSNERIPTLSGNTGPYRTRTIHRARVIGHSPLDGVALFSLEQKVLDQVFMQVDDLKVGQALKVSHDFHARFGLLTFAGHDSPPHGQSPIRGCAGFCGWGRLPAALRRYTIETSGETFQNRCDRSRKGLRAGSGTQSRPPHAEEEPGGLRATHSGISEGSPTRASGGGCRLEDRG